MSCEKLIINTERAYIFDCENLRSESGTITTLDRIIEKPDIIIPDTSILPTARANIGSLTAEQAGRLTDFYERLSDILSSEKICMHHKIQGEFQSELRKEYDAAKDKLNKTGEFGRYIQAMENLRIPNAVHLPEKYAGIYQEFKKALDMLDTNLEIRERKAKEQGKSEPTSADIENIAYAMTMAVMEPEKNYLILTRDSDYAKLTESFIRLIYSGNFSKENKNTETVAKRLGNPKLKVTFCLDRHNTQPYSVSFGTGDIEAGSGFKWQKDADGEYIVNEMRKYIGRIIQERKKLTAPKEPVKTEPTTRRATKKTVSVGEEQIEMMYKAMQIPREQVPEKIAQGTFGEYLNGILSLLQMAEAAGAQETCKKIENELRYIGTEISESQEEITEKNIRKLDEEGKLEKTVQDLLGLRQVLEQIKTGSADEKIKKSLAIAKAYAVQQQSAWRNARTAVVQEIERLRRQNEEFGAREESYGKIKGLLGDVKAASASFGKMGPSDRPRARDETKAGIIYANICTLLERAPEEGEAVPKSSLAKAMGITRNGLCGMVKRAKIPAKIMPLSKGSRTFAFSIDLIETLAQTARKKPKRI